MNYSQFIQQSVVKVDQMWKIGCHECLVAFFIIDGISSEVESAQVLKLSEVYHLQDQVSFMSVMIDRHTGITQFWSSTSKPHLIILHYQAEQLHCFQWRGCSGFEEHSGFRWRKCGCWTNLNPEVSQECPDLLSPWYYWMRDLSRRRTGWKFDKRIYCKN